MRTGAFGAAGVAVTTLTCAGEVMGVGAAGCCGFALLLVGAEGGDARAPVCGRASHQMMAVARRMRRLQKAGFMVERGFYIENQQSNVRQSSIERRRRVSRGVEMDYSIEEQSILDC